MLQEDAFRQSIVLGPNVEKIIEIASSLEMPTASYIVNGALFRLYRAKHHSVSEWSSPTFKELVMDARRSYLRYGAITPEDAYDKKSAVYITRVSYPHTQKRISCHTEEWLSIRFVPAKNTPLYTEDLILCQHDGESLIQWLAETNFDGARNEKEISKRVVTISRICGIMPYRVPAAKPLKNTALRQPTKLKYTGIAFALMNHQFLNDHSGNLRYITGIFRPELIEKTLTTITSDNQIVPDFTWGYRILGFTDSSSIPLDRSSLIPYQFPAYFLHMNQLYHALAELLAKRIISMHTLGRYIKNPDEWMQDATSFQNTSAELGTLLTAHGTLYDSLLTGDELRSFLTARIQDGAHLRMMRVDAWRKSIQTYLHLHGFDF